VPGSGTVLVGGGGSPGQRVVARLQARQHLLAVSATSYVRAQNSSPAELGPKTGLLVNRAASWPGALKTPAPHVVEERPRDHAVHVGREDVVRVARDDEVRGPAGLEDHGRVDVGPVQVDATVGDAEPAESCTSVKSTTWRLPLTVWKLNISSSE
jgi:hypothetical protein